MDWSKMIMRIDSDILYEAPTRQCLICSRLENEKAMIVKEVGWICPECAKKIGVLIGVRTYG